MTPLQAGEIEENTPHLDDDAFAELTMGAAPDAKAEAHLASCAQCREELARFREAVGDFNMASLAWSEERSEILPALRPAARKADSPREYPQVAWAPRLSWVLAVLLAIGVAVPVKMHLDAVHNLQATNQAKEADDDPEGLNSPEQIARDNQLMADVNYELSHSRAVLLSQYDRQRGAAAGSVMTETGRRSR